MTVITINESICAKCGQCTRACPHGILQQRIKGTVPQVYDIESCMDCGHCVAVCPQKAITHSSYPEGTVTEICDELLPDYDQVMELIHARRSRRRFADRQVSREDIDKLFEAARFAPSEHNCQDTEYVVVQDKVMVDEIAKLTLAYYKNLLGTLRNPIGRVMFRLATGKRTTDAVIEFLPEMDGVVTQYEQGNDYIMNHAPTLILACADSTGGFPGVNASMALENVSLAAEPLGLGCFFAGFVTRACGRGNRIARLVGLPDTHKIYGILAVGYRKVEYRRWPDRNPAQVTWIGAA